LRQGTKQHGGWRQIHHELAKNLHIQLQKQAGSGCYLAE
jgi:hypothetical protein